MNVESITKAVSNLALQFGEEDSEPEAMVCTVITAGVMRFICPREAFEKHALFVKNESWTKYCIVKFFKC